MIFFSRNGNDLNNWLQLMHYQCRLHLICPHLSDCRILFSQRILSASNKGKGIGLYYLAESVNFQNCRTSPIKQLQTKFTRNTTLERHEKKIEIHSTKVRFPRTRIKVSCCKSHTKENIQMMVFQHPFEDPNRFIFVLTLVSFTSSFMGKKCLFFLSSRGVFYENLFTSLKGPTTAQKQLATFLRRVIGGCSHKANEQLGRGS